MTFEEAKAQSREALRWLLVYVDDSGDGCRLMAQNTWKDPTVAEWIRKHDALLIKSSAPEVSRTPALLVFRDGTERDRIEYVVFPWDLIGWLDGLVARGETYVQRLELLGTGERDMSSRFRRAEALMDDSRLDEATKELEWLWCHMLEMDPAMVGVRGSYMASTMRTLARVHAPARKCFVALRDAAFRVGSPFALGDGVVLNQILDEPERSVEWFDSVKGDVESRNLFGFASITLMPLLLDQKRWADAGVLVSNPVEEISTHWQTITMSLDFDDEEHREDYVARQTDTFRETAARLNAVLRAAGRHDEAETLRREALRLDDSSELRERIRSFEARAGLSAS